MKLISTLNQALDALLPRRPRTMHADSLTAADIALSPTVHELLRARITTLASYEDASVASIIQSLKYDGSRHAARLAAAILAEYLREEFANRKLYSQKEILLVPVPLHASRLRHRAFNQIELVLSTLPREFKDGSLSRVASLLERTRETAQQTRLTRSERLGNVAGAFAMKQQSDLSAAIVYLIDDVTTTGATLVHAGAALRRAGADVQRLALARA